MCRSAIRSALRMAPESCRCGACAGGASLMLEGHPNDALSALFCAPLRRHTFVGGCQEIGLQGSQRWRPDSLTLMMRWRQDRPQGHPPAVYRGRLSNDCVWGALTGDFWLDYVRIEVRLLARTHEDMCVYIEPLGLGPMSKNRQTTVCLVTASYRAGLGKDAPRRRQPGRGDAHPRRGGEHVSHAGLEQTTGTTPLTLSRARSSAQRAIVAPMHHVR